MTFPNSRGERVKPTPTQIHQAVEAALQSENSAGEVELDSESVGNRLRTMIKDSTRADREQARAEGLAAYNTTLGEAQRGEAGLIQESRRSTASGNFSYNTAQNRARLVQRTFDEAVAAGATEEEAQAAADEAAIVADSRDTNTPEGTQPTPLLDAGQPTPTTNPSTDPIQANIDTLETERQRIENEVGDLNIIDGVPVTNPGRDSRQTTDPVTGDSVPNPIDTSTDGLGSNRNTLESGEQVTTTEDGNTTFEHSSGDVFTVNPANTDGVSGADAAQDRTITELSDMGYSTQADVRAGIKVHKQALRDANAIIDTSNRNYLGLGETVDANQVAEARQEKQVREREIEALEAYIQRPNSFDPLTGKHLPTGKLHGVREKPVEEVEPLPDDIDEARAVLAKRKADAQAIVDARAVAVPRHNDFMEKNESVYNKEEYSEITPPTAHEPATYTNAYGIPLTAPPKIGLVSKREEKIKQPNKRVNETNGEYLKRIATNTIDDVARTGLDIAEYGVGVVSQAAGTIKGAVVNVDDPIVGFHSDTTKAELSLLGINSPADIDKRIEYLTTLPRTDSDSQDKATVIANEVARLNDLKKVWDKIPKGEESDTVEGALTVPDKVGAKIQAEEDLTRVQSDRFSAEDEEYVDPATSDTPITSSQNQNVINILTQRGQGANNTGSFNEPVDDALPQGNYNADGSFKDASNSPAVEDISPEVVGTTPSTGDYIQASDGTLTTDNGVPVTTFAGSHVNEDGLAVDPDGSPTYPTSIDETTGDFPFYLSQTENPRVYKPQEDMAVTISELLGGQKIEITSGFRPDGQVSAQNIIDNRGPTTLYGNGDRTAIAEYQRLYDTWESADALGKEAAKNELASFYESRAESGDNHLTHASLDIGLTGNADDQREAVRRIEESGEYTAVLEGDHIHITKVGGRLSREGTAIQEQALLAQAGQR